jgi:hypothetical protein
MPPTWALTRAATIGASLVWFLAACNGSHGTGPSETVVIGDLQARTLQRPVADRPFNLEISVAASDPRLLVSGQAELRRLRIAQDTCQAPGASPVIATVPVEATNVVGNRIQVGFQGLRLPAGRSRLCFFLTLPGGLAEQPRGRQVSETLVARTNELDLVLDTVGGGSSPAPASSPPPPPSSLPVVTIAAPDASAAESPLDAGTFRVSRTGSTAAPLTVSYTVGGSATSGSDYTSIGATVVIPAGSATADITVTPIDDDAGEDPETVVATLSASAAYTVGGPSSATVTITSEDTVVRGSGSASGSRGREGNVPCPASSIPTTSSCPVTCPGTFDGTIFEITIIRTGSTAAALDVLYELSGTAVAGLDYFFRPQRSGGAMNQRILTFAAGASETRLRVITVAGTTVEAPEETVTLSILPGAGYTIGSPSRGTVTIVDDD